MTLPFYVQGRDTPRIVVVGGGYAGIAAIVTIREYCPSANLTVIDPRHEHLKITHLHESFRRPFRELKVPFSTLEQRFAMRHVQASLAIDGAALSQWNQSRTLTAGADSFEFDYLLIASGAPPQSMTKAPGVLTLEDFARQPGPELLTPHVNGSGGEAAAITVVGGGATGIQFLFEIAHFLQSRQSAHRLRLVDSHSTPLSQFSPKLGRYVEARLAERGIDYLPNHLFRSQEDSRVRLERRDTGDCVELPSALTLLFAGKESSGRLDTNWFGQVVVDGRSLDRVFAAGDCSRYRLPGSNALSAQSAVRKGKLAARNILRHSGRIQLLEPYLHQDLGYVISLGPQDSVGWLGLEGNVIGGQPAAVVKEIVEAQYDLLLAGVDTYLI
jgi:NADH dehydrogenase